MDWRESAACMSADPRLFDAVTLDSAAPALAICAGCPVIADCARSKPRGSSDEPIVGVWGGHVYGPKGQRLIPERDVTLPERGEPVGVCEGCGRTVNRRGRDSCPHEGSLCRRTARAYHKATYRRRRGKAGAAA
jgi:hypothetical protein